MQGRPASNLGGIWPCTFPSSVWMLVLAGTVIFYGVARTTAEPIHHIAIDGQFGDWATVPAHADPVGTALHDGIPDVHDTDHDQAGDVPSYVDHPDVDVLEYKFTHDEDNLYAYFRATGEIGRTQTHAEGRAGRYYVIVTIDVDDDDTTGYWLNEGGYFPTSAGYDMNMEVEFYDGAFNTGHYINHGARNQTELDVATQDQIGGVVNILPGSYDYYTQWVWFDDPNAGDYALPAPDNDASITFVKDKGPVYQGILEIALSPDGHEAEMKAPFRGFMRDAQGDPIMALDKTIDISFSLEASGELAPGDDWASDTTDPIVGYHLDAVVLGDMDTDGEVDFDDVSGFVLGLSDPAEYEVMYGVAPSVHGDIDADGDQDFDDIRGFVTMLSAAQEAAVSAVPEPSVLMLAAVGCLCLLGWRSAARPA